MAALQVALTAVPSGGEAAARQRRRQAPPTRPPPRSAPSKRWPATCRWEQGGQERVSRECSAGGRLSSGGSHTAHLVLAGPQLQGGRQGEMAGRLGGQQRAMTRGSARAAALPGCWRINRSDVLAGETR